MAEKKSLKVLVTGAAGFIGSNFVHYITKIRPGWHITALDSLTYAGNYENIAMLGERGLIEFVKIDINDPLAVSLLFRKAKYDMVIHFAAESHVDRSIHHASEFVRTNVLGTQNLLESSRDAGVFRFVHVSTDEVYGSIASGSFNEASALNPSSPYSASKAASDLIVLGFSKTNNLNAAITRCTNNYGMYQFPEKAIPLFITNALEDKPLPLYGDGSNVRSWLYVEDHCDGVLKVAEDTKPLEVYNIGGDSRSEITNIEVARTILRLLKKPESQIQFVKDRPAHDKRYSVDCTKIQRDLKWEQKVGFEEGLKKTVDWYMNNQSWWRNIKSGAYKEFYELNYGRRDVIGQ
jgi:dTDP-glucose 4,6-dehydratase